MLNSNGKVRLPLVVGAVGVALGLVVIVAVGPFVYQCKVHPMAKLNNAVGTGLSWTEVNARFEQYADHHDGPDLEFVKGDSVSPNQYFAPSTAVNFLHLYDWFLLDDLQLTVWFDSQQTVVGSQFVCE